MGAEGRFEREFVAGELPGESEWGFLPAADSEVHADGGDIDGGGGL